MTVRSIHTGFRERLRELAPADASTTSIGWRIEYAEGMAVLWLFHINSMLITKFAPKGPARWNPGRMPWSSEIEAAWPAIRSEVVDYLTAGSMPHTAEVSGLDPYSDEGRASVPADRGAWRTVILQFFGEWIDENVIHFPETAKAVSGVKSVTSIGFTALDAGSHIATHVGPNHGALRYQLPVIVPGQSGACRIRIGEELVEWREGESVLFDLNIDHEAWNDSDETRVLLMIEVPMPLPFPLNMINRWAQSSYRYFPSYRGLADRAKGLAVERLEALRDGHNPERYPINGSEPMTTVPGQVDAAGSM